MDLINIPACALYRNIGTVIVRIKMEVFDYSRYTKCCRCEPKDSVERLSGCEQCNRTRLVSKSKSDCDNGVVDKIRPYRSSSARSRYVNVCAAVCLLLLVGSLSPQSSAAPHRSRIMERTRRATDATENRLWGNPCDYNDSDVDSSVPRKHATEIAPKLVAQAKNANASTSKYKDILAFKLHSYQKFDDLLRDWESDEWLRKFPWFRDEVLPKNKVLYSKMPDEYMNEVIIKIDEVLPVMYKGLKMIVAGLYAFTTNGLNDDIISDESLKENITQTMHDARAVLCYFSDIMKARSLEMLPLPDSEIPEITPENKLSVGLLIYRDTLNYLEYLAQVFQKFSETPSA